MAFSLRARAARHAAQHGAALPSKPRTLNGSQVDRLLGARQTEQQIQKAIVEHLCWRARPGAFFFHVPLGGYRTRVEGAILKAIGTVAGIPDILCIFEGRVFALELKTERGKLTEIQRTTHERLRAAGAVVATAFGLDAALAQLEGWGLLRADVNHAAKAFEELRHDVARRAARQRRMTAEQGAVK